MRDFTYVEDAVNAFIMLAANDSANGQVFNLGGDTAVSLKELADLIVEIYGGGEYMIKEFPIEHKPIDIGDYYADYERIRSTFGWTPEVNLKDGLARTLSFYKKHLEHYL